MPPTDYYNKSEKKVIDEETGSTLEKTKVKRGGIAYTKHSYSLRYRTDKTDLKQLEAIVTDILSDPEKIETSLGIEKNIALEEHGQYDLVVNYSVIVPSE